MTAGSFERGRSDRKGAENRRGGGRKKETEREPWGERQRKFFRKGRL